MRNLFFYLSIVGVILVAVELFDFTSFPNPPDSVRFGLTKVEREDINDSVVVILNGMKAGTGNVKYET